MKEKRNLTARSVMQTFHVEETWTNIWHQFMKAGSPKWVKTKFPTIIIIIMFCYSPKHCSALADQIKKIRALYTTNWTFLHIFFTWLEYLNREAETRNCKVQKLNHNPFYIGSCFENSFKLSNYHLLQRCRTLHRGRKGIFDSFSKIIFE